MTHVKPDIIAAIRMYTSEAGGKVKSISGEQFGCPFFYNQEGFDCRLLLEEKQNLQAGDTVKLSIKFLFPEDIKPKLKRGDKFTLWDLGTFAEGEILEVLQD
jgi:hypothetical protein